MLTEQESENPMGKISGVEILVRALVEEKVEFVFGYPGTGAIGIYDALKDLTGIKIVVTRTERGAVHAAEAYAKSTGKPGVVIVNSGPGATGTVTGIASAYLDSTPMVIFTTQVETKLIGNDVFQEVDTIGITRPITKYNFLVTKIDELARTIKTAFYIATTGRPGPVLVDLPKDILSGKSAFEYPDEIKLRSYVPTYSAHRGQIKRAAEIINRSARPVVYAGGGVVLARAEEELKKFAKKINAPVATTLMAQGVYPEDDKLSLGMYGLNGTYVANKAIYECDCLIALGTRFNDRAVFNLSEFAPGAKKIHIDIDPANISRNVKVDVPIVSDVKDALSKLIPLVKKLDTSEWLNKIKEWKNYYFENQTGRSGFIRASYIVEKLRSVTRGKIVVVTDAGENQMLFAKFFKFLYPRTHITSGGFGATGYAIPASIGVSLAVKDKPVFAVCSNIGFQSALPEIATISANRFPVKILVFDDFFLDDLRKRQEVMWKNSYPELLFDNSGLDISKLAQAFKIKGLNVKTESEVEDALIEALGSNEPVIVGFKLAPAERIKISK